MVTPLHVGRWGSGPPVLLVHGSVMNGEGTWAEQRPLAERWELLVLDRRGYFPNPPIDREDFEVDAGDVAELLGDGMHLVGHSYGGVISLLAAARRPEAVRSLTVIEPPAFGLVADDPDHAERVSRLRAYFDEPIPDPEAFLRGFIELSGSSAQLPSPLPPPLEQSARLLMVERFPGEAVIPFQALRAAPFPTLVVSGGHDAAFTAVCDVIERELGAERAVIAGKAHSVQRTGAPFNELLDAFLRRAERSGRT
ncbi:MAG: alpha/beta fold hydrolase [Candidatus Velamenicoccus archaeovorus]